LPIEVASEDQERNEPDLAVIADPEFDHFTRPRGDESLLLVEIADSTSPLDRTVKSALYAGALVPEYWVVDLPSRAFFVHRHPSGGGFRQVTRLAENEKRSARLPPRRRRKGQRTSSFRRRSLKPRAAHR
jgi:Uma2 family endonuclease